MVTRKAPLSTAEARSFARRVGFISVIPVYIGAVGLGTPMYFVAHSGVTEAGQEMYGDSSFIFGCVIGSALAIFLVGLITWRVSYGGTRRFAVRKPIGAGASLAGGLFAGASGALLGLLLLLSIGGYYLLGALVILAVVFR